MRQDVSFFSDQYKIHGNLYLPDDLKPGDLRGGIVLSEGFAGPAGRNMDAMAKEMIMWGYIALSFDYRGFGASEGPRDLMKPLEQVEDIRNAISFLQQHPSVRSTQIGMYGASFGGANAIYATAIDPRIKCVAAVVAVGNGRSWMRSLRRGWEWKEFKEALMEDQIRRAITGESKPIPRTNILIYEPGLIHPEIKERLESNPDLPKRFASELPTHTAQAVVDFAPDVMASRITTQPALFVVAENDVRVPPEVTREVYEQVRSTKRWVVVPGAGHDDVYLPPGWNQHVDEVRSWMLNYLTSD